MTWNTSFSIYLLLYQDSQALEGIHHLVPRFQSSTLSKVLTEKHKHIYQFKHDIKIEKHEKGNNLKQNGLANK